MLAFLSSIDVSKSTMHIIPRRYESFFDSDEISSLIAVYDVLYPGLEIRHIPMLNERFLELKVFNETFISVKSKGTKWVGLHFFTKLIFVTQRFGLRPSSECTVHTRYRVYIAIASMI